MSASRAHCALTGITTGLHGRRRTSAPRGSGPGASPQGAHTGPARYTWGLLVPLLLLLAHSAAAQGSSIALTFEVVPGGAPMSGVSTNSAGLALGTISGAGPLASFLTRTLSPGAFTVSTPFGIRVKKSGPSSRHTLQARLLAPQSLRWSVAGTVMNTAFSTVASGLNYGGVTTLTLSLTVPTGTPAGPVDAAFEVLAIAN